MKVYVGVVVLGIALGMNTTMVKGEVRFDGRIKQLACDKVGPMISLKDGAILHVEKRDALISRDEGKSWKRVPMYAEVEAPAFGPDRAIIQTREGIIVVAGVTTDNKVWSVRSLDEGKTWQEPVRVKSYLRRLARPHEPAPPDEPYSALRCIMESKDGYLFTAVRIKRDWIGRNVVLIFYSNDQGESWRECNMIDLGSYGRREGAMEATMAELKDGRIWMLISTTGGRFWQAHALNPPEYNYSLGFQRPWPVPDDGQGQWFRTVERSDIPASNSPGCLKRLSSGRLVLVWNAPASSGDDAAKYSYKQGLAIAFSDDDGKTWTSPVEIARSTNEAITTPFVLERKPGVLWITTLQGNLRVVVKESDFKKI